LVFFLSVLFAFGFFVFAFLPCTVTAQWIMYRSNSVLLSHIAIMTNVATELNEFAQCNCLFGFINDLARAIWRWTEKRCKTSVLPQFCASFHVFSCGVFPKAESVHWNLFAMGKSWKSSNFVIPDDSARTARCARWCHGTVRFVWCPFLGWKGI
jgi:hypothetical protein